MAGFALAIKTVCGRDRVGIRLDHRVERRAQLLNAIQITLDQILCAQLPGRHRRLQLRDTHFDERKIRPGACAVFEKRCQTTGEQCGATGGGGSNKASAADLMVVFVC